MAYGKEKILLSNEIGSAISVLFCNDEMLGWDFKMHCILLSKLISLQEKAVLMCKITDTNQYLHFFVSLHGPKIGQNLFMQ